MVNSQEFATIKRLAAFVLSTALIALNKKLDLGLDATGVASLTGLAALYIAQSAMKSNKVIAATKFAEEVVPGLAEQPK